jgi:DNA-directed RNA polymerase subunit M/transcription elongation factor TFIIS
MSEEKPICPKCGSAMTCAVGQQRHCNACGAEFDFDKNPIATAAHQRKSQGIRGGWQRKPQK